jgi:hypothetical protein
MDCLDKLIGEYMRACPTATRDERNQFLSAAQCLRGDDQMPNGNGSSMPPRGGNTSGYVNGDFMDTLPSARLRNGNGGRDQAPPAGPMSNPGSFAGNIDQGEEDTNPDADLLLHFVEILLNKLDDDERDKFVGALHSLLSRGLDQVLAPPAQPKPNGYGGSNTTLDRGMRGGKRGSTSDRRSPAQDSAIRNHVAAVNQRGFFSRFPDAAKIRLSGSWRD